MDAPVPASNREIPNASDSAAGMGDSVRQELKRILASRYFRTAGRSRQFLAFVVEHRLSGSPEQLKERTIGTELFKRPADYATGDDPVVRVQAGEVRRRLEQFYQNDLEHPDVRIELPVGSYRPEFHPNPADTSVPAANLHAQAVPEVQVQEPVAGGSTLFRPRRTWMAAGVLGLGIVLAIAFYARLKPDQPNALHEFWSPVLSSSQPVLICLAKGVTYRPSNALYEKYRASHPGAFQTELARSNDPLPLAPDQELEWREMSLFTDYGVATGDVYAATRIFAALGQMSKTAQLRIGADYTFEDLRNSPSVVIGAFNNRWTMSQMSNLHFAFVEEGGRFIIREQVPNGRTWPRSDQRDMIVSQQPAGTVRSPQTLDYAIVGRLVDSKTGQFTIVAAGLTGAGTEAAGDFITNPVLLDRAFHNAPSNWKKGNTLLVLETNVTDSAAGPPSVIASYFWQ